MDSALSVVLTVAGSDSSGGAGMQADLKTFAALGVHGVSALTAVTAQSASAVAGSQPVPAAFLRLQIETVARAFSLAAVKTGMLATRENVDATADLVAGLRLPNLVVDPVLAATGSGRRTLLQGDAVSTLMQRLIPLAAVVTPNVDEVAALTGIEVASLTSAKDAARRLADQGARAVIVKGGHLSGAEAIDLLLWNGVFVELAAPRAAAGNVRGTGCAFASALAARLALGDDIEHAARAAKAYITGAIRHARPAGGGLLLDHFWQTRRSRPASGGLYS